MNIIIKLFFIVILFYNPSPTKLEVTKLTLCSGKEVEEPNGKCLGKANCTACKTCAYCAYCNSGGSCGVCEPGASRNVTSPPKLNWTSQSPRSKTGNEPSSMTPSRSKSSSMTPSRSKPSPSEVRSIESYGTAIFTVSQATSLRQMATHKSKVLLRLSPGNTFALHEKTSKEWWKVEYKNKIGWVKAQLIVAQRTN